MAVGDVISTGAPPMHAAIPGLMGPTVAMKKALAAYLLNVVFRVDGGDDARYSEFRLSNVFEQWPKPDEELVYPCASIIEMPDTLHDQAIDPAPLEDTLGEFDSFIGHEGDPPKTCLWVHGEAESDFQVDFWCDLEPDRQAIEAQLPSLFSPEEGRSSVVIEGPELYYGLGIEFEYVSQHFDDSGLYAQRNEKRLRCVFRASCAIVSLRMATLTEKPQACVTVVDPVDPPETQED